MERALLSCIAQDPAVIGGEVLAVYGKDNPFSDDECWRIYNAWRALGAKEWDAIAISSLLDKRSSMEHDWMMAVREVMNTAPSTAQWRTYAKAVKQEWQRRKAKQTLQQAVIDVEGAEDITTLCMSVGKTLLDLDTTSEQEQTVEDAMNEELERRRNESLTICTGLEPIDRFIAPLIPGEILLIAARPSVGKSVVAHNIIRNIAQHSAVGVFSLEMPTVQVVSRIISDVAEYDSRMVLDNMHNQQVWRAYEYVKDLPVYYDDRAGLCDAQIVNRIRRWHSNHKIKVVVLDYIQLIKTHKKMNEGISDTLKAVRGICKELGIVPIVLAQINRAGARNESGKPTLEDLKGSGSLEEDSSYVILMHRDVVLSPEQRQKVEDGGHVDLEMAVAKNRHGTTGYSRLAFVPKYCRVRDKIIDNEDIPQ